MSSEYAKARAEYASPQYCSKRSNKSSSESCNFNFSALSNKKLQRPITAYKEATTKRISAENNIAKAKEDEDNLRHWINELEQLSPRIGEIEELQIRRQELMHAEKIIENLNYAYSALTQGKDVSSSLRAAQNGIDKANSYVDGKYDEI